MEIAFQETCVRIKNAKSMRVHAGRHYRQVIPFRIELIELWFLLLVNNGSH